MRSIIYTCKMWSSMPIAYRWDTLLNVVYGAFSYVDVSQYAVHLRSNVDFLCTDENARV